VKSYHAHYRQRPLSKTKIWQ